MDSLPSTPNPVENKPKKMKQEGLGNLQDGNLEDDDLSKGSPCPDEKKPKKIKQGTLKKIHAGQEDGVAFLKQTSTHADEQTTKKLKHKELMEMHGGALLEGSAKKPRTSNENENKVEKTNEISMKDPFRNKKKNAERENKTHSDVDKVDSKKNQNDGAQHKMVIESHKDKRNGLQFQSRDLDADILLRDETELTVAGIELPLKDVGNALQLLEFCAAFGKVIIFFVS